MVLARGMHFSVLAIDLGSFWLRLGKCVGEMCAFPASSLDPCGWNFPPTTGPCSLQLASPNLGPCFFVTYLCMYINLDL